MLRRKLINHCVSCWITYILQDDTRSIQYQVNIVTYLKTEPVKLIDFTVAYDRKYFSHRTKDFTEKESCSLICEYFLNFLRINFKRTEINLNTQTYFYQLLLLPFYSHKYTDAKPPFSFTYQRCMLVAGHQIWVVLMGGISD